MSFLLPANPKANYLAHRDEIDTAIERVLDGGTYILGEEVSAFEREFADFLGAGHVIGVGNGTDALQLALRACGVGSGDVVVTVSHTAVATVASIQLTGATPILVDIDPNTYTMDPGQLTDVMRKHGGVGRTTNGGTIKAIIPVHLYGNPADMLAIMEVAERYGLYVIEDCAQAHGAVVEGRKVGTWGHLSAFSFYPTKNLGAIGDGGAVATSDPALAERVRLLREYGWRKRYISEIPGMNSRLDEIQAAILRVKLRHLDEENARRREIASVYDTSLSAVDLVLPRLRGSVTHVYHQYVVRSRYRDELRSYLKSHSVGTLVHYPLAVHMQPAYRDEVLTAPGGLNNTERVCREVLSLPVYPQMTDQQVSLVADALTHWDAQSRA